MHDLHSHTQRSEKRLLCRAMTSTASGSAMPSRQRSFRRPWASRCEALLAPARLPGRLSSHLTLQAGVVSTGNSLDFVESDLKIMQSYNTAVKEMEANAIAWVVRHLLQACAACVASSTLHA